MFRGCISVFVIAGLFASQLAAVPHAHGGSSSEDRHEHDVKPHFHCKWLSAGHGVHEHGGKAHSHAAPTPEPVPTNCESDSGDSLPSVGVRTTHHDANAVYVPSQVASGPPTNLTQGITSAGQVAFCFPSPVGHSGLSSIARPTPCWHPPDEVLDASNTYLTLRNLRI
jgi:hypothetical protein